MLARSQSLLSDDPILLTRTKSLIPLGVRSRAAMASGGQSRWRGALLTPPPSACAVCGSGTAPALAPCRGERSCARASHDLPVWSAKVPYEDENMIDARCGDTVLARLTHGHVSFLHHHHAVATVGSILDVLCTRRTLLDFLFGHAPNLVVAHTTWSRIGRKSVVALGYLLRSGLLHGKPRVPRLHGHMLHGGRRHRGRRHCGSFALLLSWGASWHRV